MALVQSKVKYASVSDDPTCCICREIKHEQKVLPCNSHSVCEECLEKSSTDDGRRSFCPLCRCEFNISPGGVKEFPTKIFNRYVKVPNSIAGVTVIDGMIYLVQSSQSCINVFQSIDNCYIPKPNIRISDLKSPQGLAGCSHNKILYISDSEAKSIHTYNISNKSQNNWTFTDCTPYGLTVTTERNILVSMLCGTNGESRVIEYTTDFKIIRRIILDTSFKFALHAVKLTNDKFIACHGSSYSLHRICLLNASGQIIQQYGRVSGGGEGQVNKPCSVALDEKNRKVFVADCFNHRILVFDTGLKFLGKKENCSDLNQPASLHYEPNTDKLYVGENSGKLWVL